MSIMTENIQSLMNTQATDTYSASAAVKEGAVDVSSSSVTGERKGGLFTEDTDGMGKEDFLMLLVTQLRYQDPLSPMENTEFLSQMAQLRMLESNNSMNKTLEELKTSYQDTVAAQEFSAQSMTNAASVSLIGKQVRLRETTVRFDGRTGEQIPIRVHLGNHNRKQVHLVDDEGEVVKTFTADNKDAQNSVHLVWDGTDDASTYVATGTYTIHIAGQDKDDALYAYVEDTVEGVRFSEAGALMKVGGRELSIGNILDVAGRGNASELDTMSTATALNLLGKHVRVARDHVYYGAAPNETISVAVNLGYQSEATVSVCDVRGLVVGTATVAADENGVGILFWDGCNSDGERVDSGLYRIEIDGAESNPQLYAFEEGIVEGVSTSNGIPQLRMNGKVVTASRILEVQPAPEPVDEETV